MYLEIVWNCKRDGGISSLLLEQLRYAGVVSKPEAFYPNDDDDTPNIIRFNLYPPVGFQVKPWCDMNQKRMASFGINARVVR
jgi:hypothetical protein